MNISIKIIKNKENKWNFPCKGISSINNTIVGFSSYGKGTVINIGECEYYKLYDIKDNWNMDNFQPIEEENQSIKEIEPTQEVDWNNISFPIWAKHQNEHIIVIYNINEKKIFYLVIYGNYIRFTNEKVFCSISDRNEWLNSLEVLPNGTKIEITI